MNLMEGQIAVEVAGLRPAARETKLIMLRACGGVALPAVDPGSHVDVMVPGGIIRQYSVTNPDSSPSVYVLGVKRDAHGRGASRFLCDKLEVGDRLTISFPRNSFQLDQTSDHKVLIAGGIGITPIWAMVQKLICSGRSWSLRYACRTRADATFLAELASFDQAQFHFDDEAGGAQLDIESVISGSADNSHFYCCGPLPMLQAFERACAGIASERVHIEYFAPKCRADRAGGFTVKLARSNRELFVPPGKTILSIMRENGIDVHSSCEEGVCGTCETIVLSGKPDHRDSILSERDRNANRTMMICCSGSQSEQLVLDL